MGSVGEVRHRLWLCLRIDGASGRRAALAAGRFHPFAFDLNHHVTLTQGYSIATLPLLGVSADSTAVDPPLNNGLVCHIKRE